MADNAAKTRVKKEEYYNTRSEATEDIERRVKMLNRKGIKLPDVDIADGERVSKGAKSKSIDIYAIIRKEIKEQIANGFINDAKDMRSLARDIHPLSREASEERESAKEGIEELLLRGGEMNMVRWAAWDHDVPLDSLIPYAKKAFEKAVARGDYNSAGDIAKEFGLSKNEVSKLIIRAFRSEKQDTDKRDARTYTLDQFQKDR